MEARKITIVSTKTQKKSVIMSGAETLGELKRDLNEAGINYEDMTFYEGTSKTELKTDASVLPKDVPYTNRTTGETKNTNELVFMLTNTNKKIKSGAMTRNEAYNAIRTKGLQKACKNKYGKNFTMCSTNDLILLIEENESPRPAKPKATKTAEVAAVTTAPATPSTPDNVVECVDSKARAAIATLVDYLYNEDEVIEASTRDRVLDILENAITTPMVSESYKPESKSPYSDNEIDAMFRGMC